VFEVDDYGLSHVLISGDIPAELEDKAKRAVANCPERAIMIE
jgi:ferredoxin